VGYRANTGERENDMKYLVLVTRKTTISGPDITVEAYLADDAMAVNAFLEGSALRTLADDELKSLRGDNGHHLTGFDWYEEDHDQHIYVRRGDFIIANEVAI
jgi:hypothetical protein